MRPWARWNLICICLLLFGTIGCDSKTNEVDLETQQAQYLLVNLPQDVQTRCETAAAAAISCGTTAGNVSVKVSGSTVSLGASTFYVGYYETAYGLSVPSPRGATELCTQLTASRNFPVPGKTNSAGVRICVHQCEIELWQGMLQSSACSSTNFQGLITDAGSSGSQTSILSLSNNAGYKTCFDNCLTRGSLLPQ